MGQPLLDSDTAVDDKVADLDAWWSDTARVPAMQGPQGAAEQVCELIDVKVVFGLHNDASVFERSAMSNGSRTEFHGAKSTAINDGATMSDTS